MSDYEQRSNKGHLEKEKWACCLGLAYKRLYSIFYEVMNKISFDPKNVLRRKRHTFQFISFFKYFPRFTVFAYLHMYKQTAIRSRHVRMYPQPH